MLDRALRNCPQKDHGMISMQEHCLKSQSERDIRPAPREKSETYRHELSHSLDIEKMESIVVALAENPRPTLMLYRPLSALPSLKMPTLPLASPILSPMLMPLSIPAVYLVPTCVPAAVKYRPISLSSIS